MLRTNAEDPLRITDHDPNAAMPRPDATSDFASGSPVPNGGTAMYAEPVVIESGPGMAAVPGYRVLREIARGGMGKVLAALDLGLDRDVALKTLLPGANADRFVSAVANSGRPISCQ